MDDASLVILGLGNVLVGDDGIGPAVMARLQRRWQAPAGVQLLDGGTLGLALLPILSAARNAILVDAVRTDAPPGTLVRAEGSEVRRIAGRQLSVHQIGVADLLDGLALRGETPARVVLVGIVPAVLELQRALSPEVEARLDELVERVVAEARALGLPLTPRSREAQERGPGDRSDRALGL